MAAIREQAPVLVKNLISAIRGEPLKAKYDGYASCPIVTGYGRLVLAEFDYEGKPQESFPFDQSKERLSMYLLKAYALPRLYCYADGLRSGQAADTWRSVMSSQTHWDQIYQTKHASEVSWFEAEPAISLDLIHSVATHGGRIIDVGGGASFLVDRLVAAGNWEVTVLDVSATALQFARARLGEKAKRVDWIQADVTNVQLRGPYDVWHDRAVFHFLTSSHQRAAYLDGLHKALRPGGHVVIGTFALHGPEQCSGLPVCRYDAESLAAILGESYSLVTKREYVHTTPTGKKQPFTFGIFRGLRKGERSTQERQ